MPTTGFDKYLEGKLKDPEFAAAYTKARAEIDMIDGMVNGMSKATGKKLTVLNSFKLAYSGWECDSDGCIVEDENKERFIILTNHGAPYFARREDLVNMINSYYKLIADTTDAIAIFDSGKK